MHGFSQSQEILWAAEGLPPTALPAIQKAKKALDLFCPKPRLISFKILSISKKATPYGAVFSAYGLPFTDGLLITAAEDQIIHVQGLDANILHYAGPPFLLTVFSIAVRM